jgi:hypothetical protein
MKYGVYSQSVWLFPDMQADSSRQDVSLTLLRGQSGGFQLLCEGLCPGVPVAWRTEGLDDMEIRVFREIAVTVNRNTNNLLHIFYFY